MLTFFSIEMNPVKKNLLRPISTTFRGVWHNNIDAVFDRKKDYVIAMW